MRGDYHGVAQGRGQVAAPTPVKVEALSRQVERMMAVSEAQAAPRRGPSFTTPAPQALAAAARVEGKGPVKVPKKLALAAPAGRLPPASSRAVVYWCSLRDRGTAR
uniref:Uncharacterized protein n=1 Tax=Arundo donax TaxID=35708 RepID=A0A0A9FF78_ARUDO